ncbi:alpha-ketoglutarate-dependent dioxygenase AlkB [Actinomycetospora cinnamomea]|uniref:DNA-N1-methyladenine dioxygenase n=1 Tax=Actinomycetospora cinnamomea TaxID=663609 RepID=A0A2U1E9F9_9PSEU|nr:alpha-ketoglutarate-dependent dioxygenase AlkB [Actinomycetospora cinnamomea]PVY96530.1 DNA-N1-methyladenine dioxygenase [Actinomycetospora cinnamomea]
MTVAWTPSLFGGGDTAGNPAVDPAVVPRRIVLDDRSWVDLAPAWITGADAWFDAITAEAPWGQRQRRMYDPARREASTVIEPRLTCGWRVEEAPDPAPAVAAVLSARYGVRFDRVACNFYRDGQDSVAWHGDRVRFTHEAPIVAIVSLGAPRRFGLRPLGGGAATRLTVAGGDLLVMGGRCQHEWQHTVPKWPGAGPRVSVTFRHDDPGPRP